MSSMSSNHWCCTITDFLDRSVNPDMRQSLIWGMARKSAKTLVCCSKANTMYLARFFYANGMQELNALVTAHLLSNFLLSVAGKARHDRCIVRDSI